MSTDADGECDSEHNPLNLDPPEVVGEFGESVLVNCTSSEENHDGIFFEDENIDTDPEEDKNFFLFALTLNQWDMNAKCIVKLNDTFECSKDLKITVYRKCEFKSIHYQSFKFVKDNKRKI